MLKRKTEPILKQLEKLPQSNRQAELQGGRTCVRKLNPQITGNEGYNCTAAWSYHISTDVKKPTYRWAVWHWCTLIARIPKGLNINPTTHNMPMHRAAMCLHRCLTFPNASQNTLILLLIVQGQEEAVKYTYVQYFCMHVHSHTFIWNWTVWEVWLTSTK